MFADSELRVINRKVKTQPVFTADAQQLYLHKLNILFMFFWVFFKYSLSALLSPILKRNAVCSNHTSVYR